MAMCGRLKRTLAETGACGADMTLSWSATLAEAKPWLRRPPLRLLAALLWTAARRTGPPHEPTLLLLLSPCSSNWNPGR